MNNQLLKNQLSHAWTNTTPERVSNYNSSYYNKHKDDWRVRREKRKKANSDTHNYWLLDKNIQGGNIKGVSKASVGLSPKTEVINNPPTKKSSTEFENVGYQVYDATQAIKKHLIDTYTDEDNKNRGIIGNIIYMIEKSKTKKASEISQKPQTKSNEQSPIVKALKSGFEYLKKWWNT